MNFYVVLTFFFVVLSATLCSVTVSGVPVIFCPPSSSPNVPLKIKQLCFVVDHVENANQEDGFEATPLAAGQTAQNDGEVMDTRMYNRDTKRQDVDHVFLRFGRRSGF